MMPARVIATMLRKKYITNAHRFVKQNFIPILELNVFRYAGDGYSCGT